MNDRFVYLWMADRRGKRIMPRLGTARRRALGMISTMYGLRPGLHRQRAAGQRAAIQASKLGKRVAVIEKQRVIGGVCIETGTIPSKTFAKRCAATIRGQAWKPQTNTAFARARRWNACLGMSGA